MISIKTPVQQDIMREGGKILAAALRHVLSYTDIGTPIRDLDQRAEEYIRNAGGCPAFLGYEGMRGTPSYPATICVSINDEVVHGIGTRDRILADGDIVGIDIGMEYPDRDGFCTDMAVTVGIGRISSEDEKLIQVTQEALVRAIQLVRPGANLRTIGKEIQRFCESYGYGVIRDLTGHGIGRALHEDPVVFHYDEPNAESVRLQEGMTICIEPMISAGTWKVKMDPDGWTIRTADGSDAAHFEHTVLVTSQGFEILTV